MSVATRRGPSPRRRSRVVASLVLGPAVAACGSSATPTGAPGVAAPSSTTSPAVATPRASASAAPAPVVTPTLAPSLAPLTLLWQQGGPATASSTTVATAIDPVTGDLWAAVPFENKYWIFSPDGKYLGSWGQAGTGPGQLALADHDQNPNGWGAIAFKR
jgi:hypothetical protein